MGNIKKKRRLQQHKTSIIGISAVIVMLAVILSFSSISLQKKIQSRQAQKTEIEAQLKEEEIRKEELDELETYHGTDEYVEDVAKDKLGLIYPNEILFQAEP